MDYVALSREVSYALRHAPWEYELELDEKGFVPIEQLLVALNERGSRERDVTVGDLEAVIQSSDKKRHEIVGDKIRAMYGHTVPQKIAAQAAEPPSILYHGTARRFLDSILTEGLKPMARQYVHLSADIDTATRVGSRRDPKPVILAVDAARASKDGLSFYVGNEKVWLTDEVPADYLQIHE